MFAVYILAGKSLFSSPNACAHGHIVLCILCDHPAHAQAREGCFYGKTSNVLLVCAKLCCGTVSGANLSTQSHSCRLSIH